MSSAHLTQQFEAVTEQTKELSGLAHKLATETAKKQGSCGWVKASDQMAHKSFIAM
jgi:hypothetical protein